MLSTRVQLSAYTSPWRFMVHLEPLKINPISFYAYSRNVTLYFDLWFKAWKLGMHGGDYAWILPEDAVDLSGKTGEWWHTRPEDCSSSELASTLDGLVVVKSHTVVLGPQKSDAGWVSGRNTSTFDTMIRKHCCSSHMLDTKRPHPISDPR